MPASSRPQGTLIAGQPSMLKISGQAAHRVGDVHVRLARRTGSRSTPIVRRRLGLRRGDDQVDPGRDQLLEHPRAAYSSRFWYVLGEVDRAASARRAAQVAGDVRAELGAPRRPELPSVAASSGMNGSPSPSGVGHSQVDLDDLAPRRRASASTRRAPRRRCRARCARRSSARPRRPSAPRRRRDTASRSSARPARRRTSAGRAATRPPAPRAGARTSRTRARHRPAVVERRAERPDRRPG